jgi:hypothetical protein
MAQSLARIRLHITFSTAGGVGLPVLSPVGACGVALPLLSKPVHALDALVLRSHKHTSEEHEQARGTQQ